jgi:hypothetical protein
MFASLQRVAEMRRQLDAMEAAWLRLVAEYDRSGDWRAEGYANTASAIRHACRMNVGTARAQVELARKLDDLTATADAFGDGDISGAHARVIADAYTAERAAELQDLEPAIVDAAKQVTPRELLAIVRRVTDAVDGDGGAATDETLHRRRRWHMSRTLDGMLAIDALLDPEAALVLEAAVTRRWNVNSARATSAPPRSGAPTLSPNCSADRSTPEASGTAGRCAHM